MPSTRSIPTLPALLGLALAALMGLALAHGTAWAQAGSPPAGAAGTHADDQAAGAAGAPADKRATSAGATAAPADELLVPEQEAQPGTVMREPERLQHKPSGFWTSGRPAVGGAYRYRLLGIGVVVLVLTGIITVWVVRRHPARPA